MWEREKDLEHERNVSKTYILYKIHSDKYVVLQGNKNYVILYLNYTVYGSRKFVRVAYEK